MRLKPLFVILLGYTLAIVFSELTFGNSSFPLNLWSFTGVAAIQWSLPVHVVGFLWMILCTRALRYKPLSQSLWFSFAYFLVAELTNFFLLDLFKYPEGNMGRSVALIFILLSYFLLCFGVVYCLRRFVLQPIEEEAEDTDYTIVSQPKKRHLTMNAPTDC